MASKPSNQQKPSQSQKNPFQRPQAQSQQSLIPPLTKRQIRQRDKQIRDRERNAVKAIEKCAMPPVKRPNDDIYDFVPLTVPKLIILIPNTVDSQIRRRARRRYILAALSRLDPSPATAVWIKGILEHTEWYEECDDPKQCRDYTPANAASNPDWYLDYSRLNDDSFVPHFLVRYPQYLRQYIVVGGRLRFPVRLDRNTLLIDYFKTDPNNDVPNPRDDGVNRDLWQNRPEELVLLNWKGRAPIWSDWSQPGRKIIIKTRFGLTDDLIKLLKRKITMIQSGVNNSNINDAVIVRNIRNSARNGGGNVRNSARNGGDNVRNSISNSNSNSSSSSDSDSSSDDNNCIRERRYGRCCDRDINTDMFRDSDLPSDDDIISVCLGEILRQVRRIRTLIRRKSRYIEHKYAEVVRLVVQIAHEYNKRCITFRSGKTIDPDMIAGIIQQLGDVDLEVNPDVRQTMQDMQIIDNPNIDIGENEGPGALGIVGMLRRDRMEGRLKSEQQEAKMERKRNKMRCRTDIPEILEGQWRE